MVQVCSTETAPLSSGQTIRCPACRLGRLVPLYLMDELSCPECDGLFCLDVGRSSIKTSGRRTVLTWRWNGQHWCDISVPEPTPVDRLAGALLLILPTLLVSVLAWCFRPAESVPLSGFGACWAVLTFVLHGICVSLAVVSYYQFSPAAWVRVLLRRGRNRFLSRFSVQVDSRPGR